MLRFYFFLKKTNCSAGKARKIESSKVWLVVWGFVVEVFYNSQAVLDCGEKISTWIVLEQRFVNVESWSWELIKLSYKLY